MSVKVRDVIERNIAPFEIAKATVSTIFKGPFIRDTFVRDRTTFGRSQRSIIGDMAKLSVKSWLEENGFEVTDWDDIRTSWRSQRKTYDLQINNHNIEVRSSISQYDNVSSVLANEHIIHPYNVKVKEITIQAFFANNRCAELWICGWALKKDLSNNSLKGPVSIKGRLVDFFRLPFNCRQARTMNALLRYLRR